MFKTVGVKSLDDLFDAIPSILMKKKKCWCGLPSRFGFIPKQYEFWDCGFVKKSPIMETAVRNYFPLKGGEGM